MNREILFRGKRDPKYGTGWCYGVPYTDHEGDCIMATDNSQRVVIEDTVGQYTGLTDKNSRKIFEGDIVETKTGRLCIVIWFSSPCFCGWDLKPTECNNPAPPSYDLYSSNNLEVISNVHDNPDLMKGEENA